MNKKRFAVMGLLLTAGLVLAACAPKEAMPVEIPQEAAESTPVAEAMPTEEAVVQATETMQTEAPANDGMASEVDVKALIEEKVAGNHDLGRIFNATKTREEWETTLDRMIGYGAKINEEEKQLIIDYLVNQ